MYSQSQINAKDRPPAPRRELPLPRCPSCLSELEYRYINLVHPFTCPACDSQLAVAEVYKKRLRLACTSVTVLIAVLLGLKNLFLLFFVPLVFYVVAILGHIFVKRMFLPPVEDVMARSKEATYVAL